MFIAGWLSILSIFANLTRATLDVLWIKYRFQWSAKLSNHKHICLHSEYFGVNFNDALFMSFSFGSTSDTVCRRLWIECNHSGVTHCVLAFYYVVFFCSILFFFHALARRQWNADYQLGWWWRAIVEQFNSLFQF